MTEEGFEIASVGILQVVNTLLRGGVRRFRSG